MAFILVQFVVFQLHIRCLFNCLTEITSLDHRPSIVATAAVLAALDSQLTRPEFELKMKLISSLSSIEIVSTSKSRKMVIDMVVDLLIVLLQQENVFSCYIVMQEIETGKNKTPKKQVISPNSSINSSLLIENLSFNSTKRRLTYNDCDQNYPVKKIYHEPWTYKGNEIDYMFFSFSVLHESCHLNGMKFWKWKTITFKQAKGLTEWNWKLKRPLEVEEKGKRMPLKAVCL